MIEAPHPLHTHIRSSSYIYNVFQHLLLWLVGIRMQPQPDMPGPWSHSQRWLLEIHSVCYLDPIFMLPIDPPTHFILRSGLYHIYLMCFSTFYCGLGLYSYVKNLHNLVLWDHHSLLTVACAECLYMYEEDLLWNNSLWVWNGWGVSIICNR